MKVIMTILALFTVCTPTVAMIYYNYAPKAVHEVTFSYDTFNEYYEECLINGHAGIGDVTVKSDGTHEVLCNDGHKPNDTKHEYNKSRLIGRPYNG